MPSIRPEIIAVVDEARAVVEDLGLRVRSAEVITSTKVDDPSSLTPTRTSSTLAIEPAPRVRQAAVWLGSEVGKVETGDVVVDRLSATYTREQLDPGGDSHWLVDGQPYRVVSVEERFTQWVVRLRRMTRNP